MNQIKKAFLCAMILLQIKTTNIFTAAPVPTSYDLKKIHKRIKKANLSISALDLESPAPAAKATVTKAIGELVKLIQGLYQIIDIESPPLGAYLETLDPVFNQAKTAYVTAEELNGSVAPTPAPVTIPQAVYTSMNSPLGTVAATAYPLTAIATNIAETATTMTTISTWASQLNFLTANQLTNGIYFVMDINSSTNIISCYVFASDKQTQIGQTFTTPLTCAPSELSVTYNSQTTTISSTLPSTFSILITSNYAKTIPSSVLTSMNSPATISGALQVPLLQATIQAQQPNVTNPIFDMGPFTASSPLNSISTQDWLSGIYITMFTDSTNVVYDFWAADKTTHLGSMSQSLPSVTGLTSSIFTYQSSLSTNTQTATITPTIALFLKATENPADSYNSFLTASGNRSTTISKTDLNTLKIFFQVPYQRGFINKEGYNAYSANGISGQLLQNTEIDLSAGIYLIPAWTSQPNCSKAPCLIFFDSNKNLLGIQGIPFSKWCPSETVFTMLQAFSIGTANTTATASIGLNGACLLKITS